LSRHGGPYHCLARDAVRPGPATEERILFFGEWRKVKGLRLLQDAFDLLSARRPGVRLTIAGAPAPDDVEPGGLRPLAQRHRGPVTGLPAAPPTSEGICDRAAGS